MVVPMEPDPRQESSPRDLERMTSTEGVGTLAVVCGVFLVLGTIASPSAAKVFLPLGALAIVLGLAVIKLARRGARR
jgi:hypothetical protein